MRFRIEIGKTAADLHDKIKSQAYTQSRVSEISELVKNVHFCHEDSKT
jgi:hypothetical protein